jgi:hypothetical protein
MENLNNEIYKVYTEQPVVSHQVSSPVQEQFAYGSIAIGTIISMTVLIREIRLLLEICKKA